VTNRFHILIDAEIIYNTTKQLEPTVSPQ